MWASNWGWVVVRGVFAVLFGLLALFMPGVTFAALMILFTLYALADGIACLITAVRRDARADQSWWLLLLRGIAGIGVAALMVFYPARTVLVFLYVLGAWAVVSGILEIAAAGRLRKVVRGEWRLVLVGVLSIAFGAVVWVWPLTGALALAWWVAAFALLTGALLISLGVRLRRLDRGGGDGGFRGEGRGRHVIDTGAHQPT
jgi:uncharacterized membrane protein HdeD (DUF308 family)